MSQPLTLRRLLSSSSNSINSVGPVDNCERLVLWLGWSCAIAMPLNSLLFFFRIKAVFHRSPGFIVFFGILWLCTLTTITAPFAVNHAISVGSPAICVETNIKSYATVGSVVIAAHDTLVYFAISLQLTMSHLPNTPYTFKDTLKIFFSGKGIGKISRSLLTTGQLYYLYVSIRHISLAFTPDQSYLIVSFSVTIGMNIIDIAILFSPAIPAVYKATFPIPNVALQNVMACRVHRQLKLGLISETSTPSSLHSSLFDGLSDQNTPKGQMTSIRFQCPNCRTTGVDHSRTYESTIASRWESDLAKRPELIETSEGIRQSDKSRHGVESVEMKDLGSV